MQRHNEQILSILLTFDWLACVIFLFKILSFGTRSNVFFLNDSTTCCSTLCDKLYHHTKLFCIPFNYLWRLKFVPRCYLANIMLVLKLNLGSFQTFFFIKSKVQQSKQQAIGSKVDLSSGILMFNTYYSHETWTK